MTDQPATKQRKGVPIWALLAIVIVAAGVTAIATLLAARIGVTKGESNMQYTQVVQLDSKTYDPAVWGQNFKIQYDAYKATANFTPTAHNAALVANTSEVHTSTDPAEAAKDTRTQTTASKLAEDPRLKIMWAGNAFALDYRHLRGHEYMLEDQRTTLRVLKPAKPQPGACLNCHGSLPEVLTELGGGQTMDQWNAGFDAMNKMLYTDATTHAKGPIACIDCHDPATMKLRITRPALINGLKAEMAAKGIANYDVNRDATQAEMRTYVCAQCHVEYYFKGDDKTLTFPWKYGTDIDNVFRLYNDPDVNFSDFTHKTTGASILKAQHPEYEAWSAGVHAANKVTCADCHMSYQRNGSQKVSNHDITTPMVNVRGTCGTCHTASEQTIRDRVATIQNRYILSRDRALDALTQLISQIDAAKQGGTVPQTQIDLALKYQREASFYTDYGYSENSYGFHAPDYFQRIFNTALDASRKGELALMGIPEAQLEPSDVAKANSDKVDASGLK